MAPTSLSSPITFKLQKKNVEKKPNREKKNVISHAGLLDMGGRQDSMMVLKINKGKKGRKGNSMKGYEKKNEGP